MRAVGNIAKQYLFTTTPVEMIALAYSLIVQYAVSCTRIAVLRLNLLFLPFVLFVSLILQFYLIRFFEWENIQPLFSTDWSTLLKGSKEVGLSFTGFEAILFYAFLMKRPKEAPAAVLYGLSIPILLYAMIYMVIIGVFSVDVTINLTYPTIELAKEVEVPGGFIERVESLFFSIWIMTIFNTSATFFDAAIMCLRSVYGRLDKRAWILIVSPLTYLLSMWPQDLVQFFSFGDMLTNYGLVVVYLIPLLLLLIAVIRGIKDEAAKDEKTGANG